MRTKLMTTITTKEHGTITVPIDSVFSLLNKKPYYPKTCKQLSYVKENYEGKNVNGGRKCIMRQSPAYKNYAPTAIPWFWPKRR